MAVGDVVKDVLVGAVGDKADLYAFFPITVDDLEELISKELASFLYRVEAGGPKEQGCFGVLLETKAFLNMMFVGLFCGGMSSGGIGFDEMGVGSGVKGGVG